MCNRSLFLCLSLPLSLHIVFNYHSTFATIKIIAFEILCNRLFLFSPLTVKCYQPFWNQSHTHTETHKWKVSASFRIRVTKRPTDQPIHVNIYFDLIIYDFDLQLWLSLTHLGLHVCGWTRPMPHTHTYVHRINNEWKCEKLLMNRVNFEQKEVIWTCNSKFNTNFTYVKLIKMNVIHHCYRVEIQSDAKYVYSTSITHV